MTSEDRIPVIAGVGEVTDRATDLSSALEPLILMEHALHLANIEAGGSLLQHIDSLDVVNQISWRYRAPADELCARLGVSPSRRNYGIVGGETPVTFLHAAAARIWNGESEVAAICGGEAHRSVGKATNSGIDLNWTPPTDRAAPSVRGQDRARPLARKFGVHVPAHFYPFFESGLTNRWGQTPQEALLETGQIWSAMSKVAATNPFAWLQRTYTPEEIMTATPSNRMIADPYRKLMIANIAVNQGGAVLVTSLARARAAGLDDGRLIFLHRGFAAVEPEDPLSRDSYELCHARDAVLEASLAYGEGFDAVELYSCFPCVPKAAARTLGLERGSVPTVAGGLTFFGAPLNNYMTHAIAAMTRRLREKPGKALVYAQGGFATKHHALVMSSRPSSTPAAIAAEASVQSKAHRRYGHVPPFAEVTGGPGTIEAQTVIYPANERPYGVVIARTASGARTLARVPGTDADGLAVLTDPLSIAIGRAGSFSVACDGLAQWNFA